MLSLWMDLVRQAFPAATPPRPARAGLTARQLNALDCISQGGITMSQLARALRVTESCATVLADRLLAAGAISRERDAVDRRLVRVVATEAGQAIATQYRQDLEAGLEQLLAQLESSKLTAITLAMSQLGDRDRGRYSGPGADDPEASQRSAGGQL
jgi:DNA-binding MarR family transcriptional regulator